MSEKILLCGEGPTDYGKPGASSGQWEEGPVQPLIRNSVRKEFCFDYATKEDIRGLRLQRRRPKVGGKGKVAFKLCIIAKLRRIDSVILFSDADREQRSKNNERNAKRRFEKVYQEIRELPGGMRHFTVPVDLQTIRKATRKLARLLQRPGSSRFKYHARHLYDWLIRPAEADLASGNIDTLVVIPDGVLRTIPLSALHDGERFLIETYAVATVPGLTLTDSGPIAPESAEVLLSGLSEAREDFDPLPHVPDELRHVRETMGGTMLQDRDYTIGNLKSEFRAHPYSILHIATHGRFGDSPQDSFLLAYDGRLTMDGLERLVGLGRFRDRPSC